jgi:hypothetical protein
VLFSKFDIWKDNWRFGRDEVGIREKKGRSSGGEHLHK